MKTLRFPYDEETGKLFFKGVRVRINNRTANSLIQGEYEKIIGPTTKTIVYNAVNRTSKIFFNYIHQQNIKLGEYLKRDSINRLLNLLPLMGYGLFEISEWDPEERRYEVKVRNCYNTLYYKDSDKPVCYEMAAKLAAIIEVVHGEKTACRETQCSAMKEYDHCVFEISVGDESSQILRKPSSIQDETREYSEAKVLFNEERGELFFENANSTIVPIEETTAIKKELEEIIGATVYTIMYRLGIQATEEALSKFEEGMIKVARTVSKKRLILKLLSQIPRRGFGIPELVEFDEEKFYVKLRVRNAMETVGYRDSEMPVCSLLAGVIAGGSGLVFNKEMDCIETRCEAMGDPCCEFKAFEKIKVREELQSLLEHFALAGGIDGSLVTAKNGNLLASQLPYGVDANRVAMASSIITRATDKSMNELNREPINKITIEASDCKLIITSAGEAAELVAITKPEASLGLIFNEIRLANKKIKEIMSKIIEAGEKTN
ncbi:MAG: hypothetical protein B6U72_06805 [Candidatus Altiarchaeales archaeon ex4484_2]|nr:MAG: hypothetical protein B6U72_06805 [Candidatus Altiarchaeales archaeon ex4484_2]